jgi:hypothetical protein
MAEPRAIHTHAIDDLRYIRDTMARAGQFSAIPGWGGVVMGVTALVTSFVAGPAQSRQWLAAWLTEAAVAVLIALVAMARKARRSNAPLLATPARRFALVLLPPLAAGAVLTAVFAANGLTARLPGCWLLLYGTSGATGGALSSVRVLPVMGVLFMVLGVAAFLVPAGWGNVFMAAGFGGLHIIFGAIIARKYGG